jgi:hypothetical protein
VPYGPALGYGLQRLIDAQQRYIRNSPVAGVFLRLKNFPDTQNQEWSEMGFSIAPSGGVVTGTTDILIEPPPMVRMVSLHNIGQSMGKLRFGSRQFVISASVVDDNVALQGLSNQDLIWRDPTVVGLVVDSELFSIEDIEHEEVGGKTVLWTLTCNALEVK